MRIRVTHDLSPRHGRTETQSAVRWHRVLHFALDAVDDDQPNVVRIQAQQASHLLHRHRVFQDQAMATLRTRQELSK